MADIEFNRSAVGINAKKDWEDADFFGQIGAQMSSATPGGVALPLPPDVRGPRGTRMGRIEMSKPISGIFSAALTLTMVLPGCSAETPAPDPTTAATDSITETETTPRWTVVIDPPKGWLLAYPRTPYDTIVVRESYKKGDREGISIGSLSNDELRKYSDHVKFSPETGMVDVDAYRDAWLANEGVHHRDISDARSMGSRTIGGEYAAGSAYTLTTDKGEVHACQLWHVRRPEGMWNFHICSAPRRNRHSPRTPHSPRNHQMGRHPTDLQLLQSRRLKLPMLTHNHPNNTTKPFAAIGTRKVSAREFHRR